MKTKFILESVADLALVLRDPTIPATTPVDAETRSTQLPQLTGSVVVRNVSDSKDVAVTVELEGDPNYEMCLPFKDFLIELAAHVGITLMGQSAIPTER